MLLSPQLSDQEERGRKIPHCLPPMSSPISVLGQAPGSKRKESLAVEYMAVHVSWRRAGEREVEKESGGEMEKTSG